MAKNEAESHFETYLGRRGRGFEYERYAGNRRPDYWIDAPSGLLVSEVRQVSARIGEGRRNGVGSLDPYKPIAKAVKRKSAQGRALAGKHPYVVVLHAPGWGVDDFTMAGAMFGKLQMVMPLNVETGTADIGELHTGFGLDATMHDTERDHISAVVILRRFNPTLRAAMDEVAAILDETGRDDRDAGIGVILEVFERRTAAGVYEEEAREPRLVTFHNPWATTPLAFDVFDGPYDQQWSATGGVYRCTHRGDRVGELPE